LEQVENDDRLTAIQQAQGRRGWMAAPFLVFNCFRIEPRSPSLLPMPKEIFSDAAIVPDFYSEKLFIATFFSLSVFTPALG
jgi:hypothetical protein